MSDNTELAQDTIVSFPQGGVDLEARIIANFAVEHEGETLQGVVCNQTPFHPESNTWKDQPGDKGIIVIADKRHPVVDTLMGTYNTQTGEVLVDTDITARSGDEDHTFQVIHILGEQEKPQEFPEGTVSLLVDTEYRLALSAGHTACHMLAFALNQATRDFWRKPTQNDSLGSPDLDQIANQTSKILEYGSTDVYRLGKSLRKKGFDTVELTNHLDTIIEKINNILSGWIEKDVIVEIISEGDSIVSRRQWRAELEDGKVAEMACGGTHLSRTGEYESIHVSGEISEDGTELQLDAVARLKDS